MHTGFAMSIVLSGCAAPREDPLDPAGKAGLIFKANAALTVGDCDTAIIAVEKIYNSSASDNQVRRLRAAAHGCRAGITYFTTLTDLATAMGGVTLPADPSDPAQLQTFVTSLMGVFTGLFPDGTGKMESSFLATDALQAWIEPGVSVLTPYRVVTDPYNFGSLRATDHPFDANLYLVLVSLASIGTTYDRYESGGHLPWTTMATMADDGCGYVSAWLNLKDAVDATSTTVTQLSDLKSALDLMPFDAACQAGCTAEGLTCTTCPSTLRSRDACTPATVGASDIEAAAAGGVISAIF